MTSSVVVATVGVEEGGLGVVGSWVMVETDLTSGLTAVMEEVTPGSTAEVVLRIGAAVPVKSSQAFLMSTFS